MILSHQYRFIFLKTIKTGGTSLEVALSKFCGPDDIITPITPEDERVRRARGYQGPRHFRLPVGRWRERGPSALARALVRGSLPQVYYNHMPAAEVRRRIGPEIWDSYFKFTIARHPFDRAVSQYFWEREWRGVELDFPTFLRRYASALYQNWEICSEDGAFLLDDFIRYEDRAADVDRIGQHLGLPESLYDVFAGLAAKGQYRPRGASPEAVLGDAEKRFLTYLCQPEMAAFGYEAGFGETGAHCGSGESRDDPQEAGVSPLLQGNPDCRDGGP